MGIFVHGCRGIDWKISAYCTRVPEYPYSCGHFHSYCNFNLDYDLSDDDEGGFSKRQTGWEKSQGTVGDMGGKLAH